MASDSLLSPSLAQRMESNIVVHYLYRLYAFDDLLYIGVTNDIGDRLKAHCCKPWWHQVTSIDVERFDDRDSVEQAEVLAIRSESPRYNIVHNRRRHVGAV